MLMFPIGGATVEFKMTIDIKISVLRNAGSSFECQSVNSRDINNNAEAYRRP